jgi:hypothetical protein
MEEKLYSSAAAEASAVVSAVPAYVKTIIATNGNAAKRFLHVFDLAALPADGVAPTICVNIPLGDTVIVNLPLTIDQRVLTGVDRFGKFETGVVVCLSTTAATKTIAGADGVFTVLGQVV